MTTIDKKDFPEVFMENDELTDKDKELFIEVFNHPMSDNERIFFEKMKAKEEGEFAPSADLVMDEYDNEDEIFIVRYYYDEYKIGRGLPGRRSRHGIYCDTLADALNSDLYILLNKHITLIEWLRSIDFKGINYNGNFILKHI